MPPNEKLQLGHSRRPRPATSRGADGASGSGLRERLRRRRAAKKRRLAKLSPGKRLARRLGVIGTWLLGIVALTLVASVGLFYTLSDVPRPESLPLPQVASVLYSDGSVMARIGTQNRTIVALDKVPETVRWAVLAAEDRRFYKDPGVSLRGTLRAAVSDVTGGDTQGGSGITQQYAKNAYLNDARTLSRKLRELAIAVKLTRQYSKDQILEFYLNTVYFGRGAYGIQAAAQTYFGRSVTRLDTAQAAVLAALLRAPSYYDPAANPDAARARWQYVLDGMMSTGHLDPAFAAKLKYPKVSTPRDGNGLGASGPKYLLIQQVLADLQLHGISEQEIYARGMQIRTTIDRKAQDAALSALSTTFGGLTKQQKNLKNALVAVDPATGGVLAYYGGPYGTGYDGKPDYNDYAAIGSRPAGSSFKPYTLATVLSQTLKKTPGKPRLSISSYVDGSYCTKVEGTKICNDPGDAGVSGPSVTVANAMKWSLNTTFDELAVLAGPNNVAALAHAMGIAKTDSNGKPTLQDKDGQTTFGIGIGDYSVSPLDQAVGYATLANGGMRNAPYFVERVTDSGGGLVYTHKESSTRALDTKAANDVSLTLQPIPGYYNRGLAGGRVAAAKTGTVGILGTTKNSDAWMVGYTPQVSVAVWTGSGNSITPIYNSYGAAEYGSDLPGRTWKLFLDTYLAGQPNLPMATTQQVLGGADTAPRPKPTPSPTPTRTTSQPAPSPSFSRTTGFPPPSSTVPSPTIPPEPTLPPAPTPTCTPALLQPCP